MKILGHVKRTIHDDPGVRLKMLMAERDVNVTELAYMTGLSRQTISSIRSGMTEKPNYDTMYLIAKALEVKVNDIWRRA